MFGRPSLQRSGTAARADEYAPGRAFSESDPFVERLYDLLHEVIDPEIGVNIVDLGLVFEVTVVDSLVSVRMTLTTPACPLSGYMDEAIRQTLTRLPDVDDTRMDLVWEPAWGPHLMSDEARQQLGWPR